MRLHLQQVAHAVVVLDQHHLVRVDVELLAGAQQLQAAGPRQKVLQLELPDELAGGHHRGGGAVAGRSDGGGGSAVVGCRVRRRVGTDLERILFIYTGREKTPSTGGQERITM